MSEQYPKEDRARGCPDWIKILDTIGIYSLLAFVLLYLNFRNFFAEVHVELPFLDFPVFVGEWLLGWLMILLVARSILRPPELSRREWMVIGAMTIFVLSKSFHGYVTYGPLAFRNAAMFYYMICALFACVFFRPRSFPQPVILLVMAFLFWGLAMQRLNTYYAASGVLLSVILVRNVRWRIAAVCLGAVLAGIVIWKQPVFIIGGRSHMLSLISLAVYLCVCLVGIHFRSKPRGVRWGISLALAGGALLLIFIFSDPNGIRSLTNPGPLIKEYQVHQQKIERNITGFQFQAAEARLYNPDAKISPDQVRLDWDTVVMWATREPGQIKLDEKPVRPWSRPNPDERVSPELSPPKMIRENKEQQDSDSAPSGKTASAVEQTSSFIEETVLRDSPSSAESKAEKTKPKTKSSPQKVYDVTKKNSFLDGLMEYFSSRNQPRALGTAYGNILFRYFIWRDMLVEIAEEKPWFGINFGKPQRSVSIEILNWAHGEWSRDGWITPHNLVLHWIYRGGLVGLAVIAGLVFFFVRVSRIYIQRGDVTGVLIVGMLVYWFVLSQFLVILEFPHYAIPFWTFVGILWKREKARRVFPAE